MSDSIEEPACSCCKGTGIIEYWPLGINKYHWEKWKQKPCDRCDSNPTFRRRYEIDQRLQVREGR